MGRRLPAPGGLSTAEGKVVAADGKVWAADGKVCVVSLREPLGWRAVQVAKEQALKTTGIRVTHGRGHFRDGVAGAKQVLGELEPGVLDQHAGGDALGLSESGLDVLGMFGEGGGVLGDGAFWVGADEALELGNPDTTTALVAALGSGSSCCC